MPGKTITAPKPSTTHTVHRVVTTIARKVGGATHATKHTVATKTVHVVHTAVTKAGAVHGIESLILSVVPWIILAFVAVTVILVVVKRRGGEIQRSVDLSTISKMRPDAVAYVRDLDTHSGYYVPLYWQGGYYTFRVGKDVGVFIPTVNKPYRCGRYTCFDAVKVGNVMFERDAELEAKLGMAAMRSPEIAEALSSPLPEALDKLMKLSVVVSERSGRMPMSTSMGVEVSPQSVLIDVARYIAKLIDGVIGSLRSLTKIVIETGGAIEKKSAEALVGLAKYMPYIAVGIGILMVMMVIPSLLSHYAGGR